MKKLIYILIGLMGMTAVQAQNIQERLQVLTDKDFYLAGENIGLKLYGTGLQGKALTYSRVAYVELLGDKENAVQLKVELNEATGDAVMQLPYTLASGMYELVAYTRWMRNEGEAAFFRRKIGIFNSLRYAESKDRIEFVDGDLQAPEEASVTPNMQVKADKSQYGNREKVTLSLAGIPEDASVSVSVVRKDIALGQVAASPAPLQTKEQSQLLPEIEGLIIDAECIGQENGSAIVRPNISIQGDHLQYYAGLQNGDNQIQFHTTTLKGVKEVVAGMNGTGHLELLSPFVATAPETLQPITLYRQQEEALTERSIALQATDHFYGKEQHQPVTPELLLPGVKPKWVYDLDHYKRFTTFEETFIEFMPCVSALGNKGNRRIVAFDSDVYALGSGNTLVLLDGVAIMDHELLLAYDPYLTKIVEVYVEDFAFGDQLYNGILHVKTPNRKLSGFTLPSTSVMCEYEGVQADRELPMPSMRKDAQACMPDFRHTLYWNPSVTANDQQLELLTSDMCGTYIVKVEGRTTDGKAIHGATSFEVKRE